MPSATPVQSPGLTTYLKLLKTNSVEASIEQLILLLKRRQIKNSRPCALATTHLMLRVVADCKHKDPEKLMTRIRQVGQRLASAQPREMVVGNIVKRVLGLVREIADEESEANASDADTTSPHRDGHSTNTISRRPGLSSHISVFSPLRHGATQATDNVIRAEQAVFGAADKIAARPPLLPQGTSYAPTGATSLFGIFSGPDQNSGSSTPLSGFGSPKVGGGEATFETPRRSVPGMSSSVVIKDIRPEVLEGIREILDELEQVDEQIASYALEHIHSNEIILTHTSSLTVQKFLLTAARKRKFTVVHVEGYPNDSVATYDTLMRGANPNPDPAAKPANAAAGDDGDEEDRWKPLTSLGITVILIPDSAVYALMSRVNKVLLATHSVLANGGLVAAAGARAIAAAAKKHQTPVVVLSGVYKLSPIYPFDMDSLIEWGEAGKVVPFSEGEFVDGVEVLNPLYDYVPPELVDLYITNLGGHAPSYLYRIVSDHYHVADTEL